MLVRTPVSELPHGSVVYVPCLGTRGVYFKGPDGHALAPMECYEGVEPYLIPIPPDNEFVYRFTSLYPSLDERGAVWASVS